MYQQQYRPSRFNLIPPVIKNLLIINGIFFLATIVAKSTFDIGLEHILGMHFFASDLFKPFQLITYMFMHGGLMHILFNMFALWMFGAALENLWGPKRFLLYFFVTGIGAVLLHELIAYFEFISLKPKLTAEQLSLIYTQGAEAVKQGMTFTNPLMAKMNGIVNGSIVGASGAVFGILLAFGMQFPNHMIYLYFAIPIRAKYFVIFYGAFELWSAIQNNPGDNVAHFAHLGGMLFGFILIKYWNKRTNRPTYFD